MKISVILFSSLAILGSSQLAAENAFHYDYATVLQSKPVYRIVEVTKEEQRCRTEEVVYQQPQRKSANNSLVGGLIGAAVGHALGSRSKHRTGVTIAGAVVGASIAGSDGHSVKKSRGYENRCELVPTSWEEERIIGYNVAYRYNGRTFETRLPFEPGDSLNLHLRLG